MAEQIVKQNKKQWYQLVAPKQFDEIVLGETLVGDAQAMSGKTLSHNLMNLTNDPKRQNINIHFKIVDVQNNRGLTSIIGYEIAPSSVKRFVRRSNEKIDLSFVCDTADNVFVRVKPLLIAKSDVKGSVAARLRNTAAQHLAKAIKKLNYNDLMAEIISHKLQSEMKAALNKIYPLKICEIRYAGIEVRKHGSAPVEMPKQEEAEETSVDAKEEKAEVKEEVKEAQSQ